MFGRVISKIFKRSTPAAPAAADASPFARNKSAGSKTSQLQPAAAASKQAKSTAPTENATDAIKKQWAAKAKQKLNATDSPESLCGITNKMTQAAILEQLAVLYRRHNRAASSLDPDISAEAEIMLEAIATLKETYLHKPS